MYTCGLHHIYVIYMTLLWPFFLNCKIHGHGQCVSMDIYKWIYLFDSYLHSYKTWGLHHGCILCISRIYGLLKSVKGHDNDLSQWNYPYIHMFLSPYLHLHKHVVYNNIIVYYVYYPMWTFIKGKGHGQ